MGETIADFGYLAGICGYDGDDPVKIAVDEDGKLQIEIDTSALPSGAATAANQVTMITALQLIDDLRNALDSVGTDELDVNVEASVLPTDAATQTTLAGMQSQIGAVGGGDAGTLLAYLLEIQARLGDETSPATGTVNKQLADLLVELGQKLETADLNIDAAKDLQVDVKTLPGDGLQVRRGDHTVVYYSDVPGDTSAHTLASVSGAGCLEWVHVASDHSSSHFYVTLDGDSLLVTDVATPTVRGYVRPVYLQYGEKMDSLFHLVCYDTDNDYYGAAMSRPVWFNTSLLVGYGAGSATAKVCVACGYHLF